MTIVVRQREKPPSWSDGASRAPVGSLKAGEDGCFFGGARDGGESREQMGVSPIDRMGRNEDEGSIIDVDERGGFQAEPKVGIEEGESIEYGSRGGFGPALRGVGAVPGTHQILTVASQGDRATGIEGCRAVGVEADQHKPFGFGESDLNLFQRLCRRVGCVGAKLGDADDAAVDQDAEAGAQRTFNISYDLFRVVFVTGQDVDLDESSTGIDHDASRDHTRQSREQPFDSVLFSCG